MFINQVITLKKKHTNVEQIIILKNHKYFQISYDTQSRILCSFHTSN